MENQQKAPMSEKALCAASYIHAKEKHPDSTLQEHHRLAYSYRCGATQQTADLQKELYSKEYAIECYDVHVDELKSELAEWKAFAAVTDINTDILKKQLADKRAEIDRLKTSIERINGVVKWQQEYCLDYVRGFKLGKQQYQELSAEIDKWKQNYTVLLEKRKEEHREERREHQELKAAADKLALQVKNYKEGVLKTDFGDLCDALSEYESLNKQEK